MRIERYEDVTAFYERVEPFLLEREAQHGVQLGFRSTLERDRRAFGPGDPVLLAVVDDGVVVGVATQTPPHPLLLSEMSLGAVGALLEELRGHELSGVGAPVEIGSTFVVGWPRPARLAVEQRLYRADAVIAPAGVPGAARPFRETTDRDLAVAWVDAFAAEAAPDAAERPGKSYLRRWLESGSAMRFWEDAGEPVSFLVYGSPTVNGMRIGPVYTPPERRGRGYASALTASATQEILDSGKSFASLVTDLANPTSNSSYQRVGYRPVADVNLWRFDRA